jgi:hypothetical protein
MHLKTAISSSVYAVVNAILVVTDDVSNFRRERTLRTAKILIET